jgi:hypothetical protein
MGGILDVRWALIAQGVIQQIGQLGVALITLVCYVHPWTKGRLSTDPEKWYKFRLGDSDGGSLCVANAAHRLLSYPLAYSLMVLPLSITRWLLFNHKKISSATTFFAVSMFNLSGAINVLVFLIVRPQLLFSSLEEFSESEIELGH